MRGHSTKNQLKEKSPHAKIILSNTWPALLLCTFREIQRFRSSVLSEIGHPSTVRPGALRTTSSPWPERRIPPWTDAGVGGGEPRRRWQFLCWLHHPWRPARARARSPRHPSPPIIPWPFAWLMHASAPPLHRRRGRQAQGTPSTADGPTPPRSIEHPPKLLILARLVPKCSL